MKRDVTRESRQGFGSGALKRQDLRDDDAARRVRREDPEGARREFVNRGVAERFEPGPGRVMNEWLAFDGHPELWTGLAKEAYQFVKGRR